MESKLNGLYVSDQWELGVRDLSQFAILDSGPF